MSDLFFEEGKTIKEAAALLKINYSSARSIICKIRHGGCAASRKRGGNNIRKLSSGILESIENIVEHEPLITLKEISSRFATQGISLSISTIHRGLEQLKITVKKASRELENVNSQNNIQKRKLYALDFSQNSPSNKKNCIFIDECGFNCHLRKTCARSRIGLRANIVLPTIRGRNITLIAAINSENVIHYKIVSDGTCNSAKFGEFLSELVQILNNDSRYKGSWLILDNAQIHKSKELRDLILNTSYILKFLAPYSYMLNPIENAFSKVKATVKRILSSTSNDKTLREVIIEGVKSIESGDCSNYIIHMMSNISLAITETVFKI